MCPHCKSKRLLIEKLDRECKEARIAKASKECIEALEEGVRRAEAVLEEHISRDLQQRAEIHRWTNVSRELEARERARGIDPNAQHAPCSRDAVRIVHCDDMTTTNHPSTPLDVGGRLAAFPIKVNGQHDMGKEKANILLSGLGAPSKNNNVRKHSSPLPCAPRSTRRQLSSLPTCARTHITPSPPILLCARL